MLDLSLQQLFGVNATQDSQTLTINKADLPRLAINANNRGEQLLAAILLQAHQNFEGFLTDEFNRMITDIEGNAITFSNQELYKKLSLTYWRQQYDQSFIVDIFILDVFVTPPTKFGDSIDINALDA